MWRRVDDGSGNFYYYNNATAATQWEVPEGFVSWEARLAAAPRRTCTALTHGACADTQGRGVRRPVLCQRADECDAVHEAH